jgi:hypothetical protein
LPKPSSDDKEKTAEFAKTTAKNILSVLRGFFLYAIEDVVVRA